MPGELANAHADLEKDCANCHESFQQGEQGTLCLDCHKTVRADIAAGTGFHGRAPEVSAATCSHCHTDHKGRDARIVLLDTDTFDHALTDFALTGRHARAVGTACHAADKPFRAAGSTCIDCHRGDDAHKGGLGPGCADCHVPAGWKQVSGFDHSRTGFALVGAHARTACTGCHSGPDYAAAPTTCNGCHASGDPHRGALGPACETCHATASWVADVTFDHDFTDFPLLGLHAVAACEACHFDASFQVPAAGCVDCHRADDKHRGTLGPACGDCHNPAGWELWSFDHDRQTKFRLTGAHATSRCSACHLRATETRAVAPTRCAECHAAEDVHRGSFGSDCARCHTTSSFRGAKLR